MPDVRVYPVADPLHSSVAEYAPERVEAGPAAGVLYLICRSLLAQAGAVGRRPGRLDRRKQEGYIWRPARFSLCLWPAEELGTLWCPPPDGRARCGWRGRKKPRPVLSRPRGLLALSSARNVSLTHPQPETYVHQAFDPTSLAQPFESVIRCDEPKYPDRQPFEFARPRVGDYSID